MRPPKLQDLILELLPPRRSKVWMLPLELAALNPKLRSRSLHPCLERMTRVRLITRRPNAVTQRWEYARMPATRGRS